jgi:hypothetical protein
MVGADRNAVCNENALKIAIHTVNIANKKELILMAKQDYNDEPTEENKRFFQTVRIEYKALLNTPFVPQTFDTLPQSNMFCLVCLMFPPPKVPFVMKLLHMH